MEVKADQPPFDVSQPLTSTNSSTASLYPINPAKRNMTAVDSQTVMFSDTPDFVFNAKKDNDNAQAGALNGISEELETPSSDFDPLIYFRKGDGRRPVTSGGGLKATKSAKRDASGSSSKINPPARQPPVAANPPKASKVHPKNKAKK